MNRGLSVMSAVVFFCQLVANPRAEAAVPCEALIRLALQNATVTTAESIATGGFVPPGASNRPTTAAARQTFANLPAFCRVGITSTPSGDSDIKIEVWLPTAGWNGNLQAVGDGGLAGFIPYALMAPALSQGYVTAGTDTGHVGGNAAFMPGHPEKLLDFAYRATHEMAVAAKAVIAEFYGRSAATTYYNACSGGGRQALASAQRYPADFHGIVAGASTWDQARLDAARLGINLTVNRSPASQIPASKYPMIHNAVLQACDAADGVRDGLLENPRSCRFDYASLACKDADGPSCLTAPQVESARVLTSPFRDPLSGRILLESHLWPGAELQWGTLGGPQPLTNSLERVRNFHLKEPAWQVRLDNIAEDVERAARMDGGVIATSNFNLKPFFERGGKLLMWHGWADPQVPAEHSILFFNNVLRTVGAEAEQSAALFMLPGVGHCSGGPGPDNFDKMDAISAWVEHGRKPQQIIASHTTEGRIDRTRPLCPFPQVARYRGQGSTDEAASFSCVLEPPSGLSPR